ncbi:MAG TPA: TetR family transcriptional regulator [Gaiellales bacterium]|jgi:AcrR family transcriptional regulator
METAGLRERKKQATRELIAENARRLFAERGFEGVTVAEVARAADVSQQTVFNYFPRKEDLVYWRLESFEEDLLSTIRERPAGESVLAAFGRFLLVQRGLLASGDPDATERLVAITRMIAASPALRAREREVFADYTASLAALIAAEPGSGAESEAWVAANAMIGAHRALVDHARRRIVEGADPKTVAREVGARGRAALALLERGLGGYAVRPGPGRVPRRAG